MKTHPYRHLLLLLPVLALCLAGDAAPAQRPRILGRRPPVVIEIVQDTKSPSAAGDAADRQSIEQSSRDFSAACAKRDAKAVAALWTEHGEYHSDDGVSLHGRGAIEAAFRKHFEDKRVGPMHVVIESIHFPARDLAVEEGLVKQEGAEAELPSSTRYSVLHVRENGQWKIAIAREWGAGQDRLHDLDWLVGVWTAKIQDNDVSLAFTRDKDRPFISGQFTKRAKSKTVASGTMKIAFDPQTGRLRSWHFEDDGGYGQALWIKDGNRWVLDAVGVLADGAETACVNILGRVGANEITWRSIDRVVGDTELPDTAPVKLTRSASGH